MGTYRIKQISLMCCFPHPPNRGIGICLNCFYIRHKLNHSAEVAKIKIFDFRIRALKRTFFFSRVEETYHTQWERNTKDSFVKLSMELEALTELCATAVPLMKCNSKSPSVGMLTVPELGHTAVKISRLNPSIHCIQF